MEKSKSIITFCLAEYESTMNQLKFCTFLRGVMNTVGVKQLS